MKKIASVLMILVMMFSLAGCKSATETTTQAPAAEAATEATTETAAEAPAVYPAEKVLIGVEIYDPTESETLEIQKYFEYLSENYNVEFKYSEAIQDADQEMKFIEDCAIAGCQGFYGYYNVTGQEQVNKVIEMGMYFYGGASDIYDAFKAEPNYLGSITGNGSDFESGKALGEWVIEQGFTNVIYANGGADFGVPIFVDRQAGFMEAVGDKVAVTVVKGFPNDQFFADQAAALATPDIQAVVASFNGVDFWAQPIASAGLTDVKLATIGAINDAYLNAFKNNQLSFLVAGNIQANGFAVGMICNAVDGNAENLKEDGIALHYAVPTFEISDLAEIEKIVDVQTNEKIFTADDLKTIAVSLNADATAQTVKDLADSGSKENVLSK